MILKVVLTWLICGAVGLGTSLPLKDHFITNTRIQRSPDDNFSLFGFNLGRPLSIFKPVSKSQSTNGYRRMPENLQPYNTNTNHRPIDPQRFSNPIAISKDEPDMNVYGKEYTKTPEIKTESQRHDIDDREFSSKGAKNHENKLLNVVKQDNVRKTKNSQDGILTNSTIDSKFDSKVVSDKYQNNENEIDKKLIDYIFNENDQHFYDLSTTEDTTINYTTETGDYDTSTIDDLLRIPGPVVASLLG